jgi:hypothetical protein
MISARLFISILLLLPLSAFAQKNVTIVTKSELTGIQLPAGSQQDKRILSRVGANSLLDMKAKELGKTIQGSIEVIYFPLSSGIKSSERVIKLLSASGFTVNVIEGDTKYSLLAKGGENWLVYIDDTKRNSFNITSYY